MKKFCIIKKCRFCEHEEEVTSFSNTEKDVNLLNRKYGIKDWSFMMEKTVEDGEYEVGFVANYIYFVRPKV